MSSKKYNRRFSIKNDSQKILLNDINNKSLVFAIGGAGSGKTFISAAIALEYLEKKLIKEIILVRPIVATEDIGFLPGTLFEKVDPYMKPLLHSFYDLIDKNTIDSYIKSNKIIIEPLAFMRGVTYSNSFVILDEAQNTTIKQIKMFLTRFGENTKCIITGDLSQSDLKEQNGLQWSVETLKKCNLLSIVNFKDSEIIRSSLVQELIKYF